MTFSSGRRLKRVRSVGGTTSDPRFLVAVPHPERDEAGDHRHEEDLSHQRLEGDERLRQADRRAEVAEAERRQHDEAEVEVLRLLVRPLLREEVASRKSFTAR